MDSDSSKFSWTENGDVDINFPKNYIRRIKDNIGIVDFIFVSSHKEVRNELNDNNIKYTLYYPNENLLTEYTNRFIKRGDADSFINFIKNNWSSFILDLSNERCDEIEMNANEYLSDYYSSL